MLPRHVYESNEWKWTLFGAAFFAVVKSERGLIALAVVNVTMNARGLLFALRSLGYAATKALSCGR